MMKTIGGVKLHFVDVAQQTFSHGTQGTAWRDANRSLKWKFSFEHISNTYCCLAQQIITEQDRYVVYIKRLDKILNRATSSSQII